MGARLESDRPAAASGADRWGGWIIVAAAAAFGLACLVTYLTGCLARLLTWDGPVGVPVARWPRLLTGWRKPADPGSAWPASMPGPVAWYLALVLIVALVAGLGFAGWRLAGAARGNGRRGRAIAPPKHVCKARPRLAKRSRRYDGSLSAAWATKAEVAGLVVPAAAAGRITLGYAYGSLVATEPEHSVLIAGATRSGKTRYFATPAIIDWRGAVLVESTKTDLLVWTRSGRAALGPVWVFDPAGVSGLPSNGWDPLAHADSWGGAQRVAHCLTGSSPTVGSGSAQGALWQQAGNQLLAPLMRAAHLRGGDMSMVIEWLARCEDLDSASGKFAEALTILQDEEPAAWVKLLSVVKMEDRLRSSYLVTCFGVLGAYEDPGVVACSRRGDIDPEAFLDGSARTLYMVGTADEQERLAPIFSALRKMIVSAQFRRAARNRAHTGRAVSAESDRVLVVLDEVLNGARLSDLPGLARTGGGEGLTLLTIVQDLSGLEALYGREWRSIVSNHVVNVALRGIKDPDTLSYFESVIGREDHEESSVSVDDSGRRNVSTRQERRALIERADIRQLERGEGIAVYAEMPPIRFGLRDLDHDPDLVAALAAPPAPPTPARVDLTKPRPPAPAAAPAPVDAGGPPADVAAAIEAAGGEERYLELIASQPERTDSPRAKRPQRTTAAELCDCGCYGTKHKGEKHRGGCTVHDDCPRFRRVKASPRPVVSAVPDDAVAADVLLTALAEDRATRAGTRDSAPVLYEGVFYRLDGAVAVPVEDEFEVAQLRKAIKRLADARPKPDGDGE